MQDYPSNIVLCPLQAGFHIVLIEPSNSELQDQILDKIKADTRVAVAVSVNNQQTKSFMKWK